MQGANTDPLHEKLTIKETAKLTGVSPIAVFCSGDICTGC